MSATERRFESARRHLDVFEESWQPDHDAAMRCRDFEDFLAELVMIFRIVDRACRTRREDVYRGEQEPDPDDDRFEKQLYERWLRAAERAAVNLGRFEREFPSVVGSEEFRECRRVAETALARWVPALPARSVGLRVWDVTEEEADELRTLLDCPPGEPGRLTWKPESLPPGDPSILR
jgi:hypothetical protein